MKKYLVSHDKELTLLETAWSCLQTKLSVVETQTKEMIPFEQVEILTFN